MRTLSARPALRWVLPLVLLLVLLGSVLVATRANADPALPPRSAEQLLVDLQTARVDGLSGTVVQNADLGIPALPGGSDGAAGKFSSLISGSHTLRVWYSGPDKARLALQEQYAETDVITNGSDVWTYDSQAKTATHRTLPADPHQGRPPAAPTGAPKTPQEAAQLALQAIGKTTDVGTDRAVSVAGRQAYELVLTPTDKASLVTGVRIAIDGKTHLPLRVQVFGAGAKPVIEIGYTSLSIGRPDARMFAFNPPAGTKVTQGVTPAHPMPTKADQKTAKKQATADKAKADAGTTVVGNGWTQVVITKVGQDAAASNGTAKAFVGQLKPVSGSWGSGRELAGTIFTAILTDDGRLAVGAVGPDQVQRALAR